MHDRLVTPLFPSSLEAVADEALLKGNQNLARIALFSSIKRDYTHNPESYHHVALKSVALPFYDLADHGATAGRLEEATAVYGWTGSLIENELLEMQRPTENPKALRQRIGRVSELVIFGLLAREFNRDHAHVPLPATRESNKSAEQGTDFLYYPVSGATTGPTRLQVKTLLKNTDYESYPDDIVLVGLNQIDPHYGMPNHSESLANRIVRELNGTATGDDKEILSRATLRLHGIISAEDTEITASAS